VNVQQQHNIEASNNLLDTRASAHLSGWLLRAAGPACAASRPPVDGQNEGEEVEAELEHFPRLAGPHLAEDLSHICEVLPPQILQQPGGHSKGHSTGTAQAQPMISRWA
jgi:hypothetical protein